MRLEPSVFSDRTIAMMHYSCPPVIGGVEFVLEAQARWFNRLGADVKVLVGQGESFHNDIPVHQIDLLRSENQTVTEATNLARKGNPDPLQELRSEACDELEPYLQDVDTVIPHNLMTMPFNLAATAALDDLAHDLEAQIFPWVHDIAWLDDSYDTPNRWPFSLLSQPTNATAYVAISQHRQKQLQDLFDDPIQLEVIHDAIQMGEFHDLGPRIQQLVDERKLHRDDIIALYPARIVRRKNIEKAIRIVKELSEYGNRIHLIITGPPDPHNEASLEYYEELKQLREDLGLQEEVIFCYELKDESGERLTVSYDQIRQFYRLSDILLMTTKQEGFGLPLLEAGLSKTLIVCSDIQPLPEVGGDAALYVDLDAKSGKIAGRIQENLENQSSVQLQRRIRQNFTWAGVFEQQIIPLLTEQYPL